MATQPASHIAETLLQRVHDPETATKLFNDKVKKVPLLLRPTDPDPKVNARSKRQYERLQKQKARRKRKPLSAKQKRAMCIYDIPRTQQKYAIYEPLHRMWCGYMQEILGLKEGRMYMDANTGGPLLVSADYHGAKMEVVRSRCSSRVGVKGIVVKDTKFTFELITEKNELKIVPKEHTVFRFEVPFAEHVKEEETKEARKPLVFEIYGNQFEVRAPDRANRKFKMHIDDEL